MSSSKDQRSPAVITCIWWLLLLLVLAAVAPGAAAARPGDLDPTFGDGRIVVRGAPAIGAAVSGVVVQPDGRIVVAGTDGPRIVLVRYRGSTRACGDADGDATLTVTDGVRVLRAAAALAADLRCAVSH
jgi:hypothetical protein